MVAAEQRALGGDNPARIRRLLELARVVRMLVASSVATIPGVAGVAGAGCMVLAWRGSTIALEASYLALDSLGSIGPEVELALRGAMALRLAVSGWERE